MSINVFFTNDTDDSIVEVFDGEEFRSSKFNLNMTTASFRIVWSALGFTLATDGDDHGTMHPLKLVNALKNLRPELLICGGNIMDDVLGLGGTQVHFGIHKERAERYITRLTEIANEALRREENIVWS